MEDGTSLLHLCQTSERGRPAPTVSFHVFLLLDRLTVDSGGGSLGKACRHQPCISRALLCFHDVRWLYGKKQESVPNNDLSHRSLLYFSVSELKKKKRILIPLDGWHSKSVAMAVVSKFKSLHCFQSNTAEKKKVLNPPPFVRALPEAAGSQDPQVFHTHRSPRRIPPRSPEAPEAASPLLFSTSADQIPRWLWDVVTHWGQHPATSQRRCH